MINYQKLYGSIGLATKASKIVAGTDACIESIENKSVKLILIAKDASDRTKKIFKEKCNSSNIPIYEICEIESLSRACGKLNKAVIGIKEKGFAESIIKIINGGEVIGKNQNT